MRAPRVLYLVCREGLSTIFDAQVLQPLSKVGRSCEVQVLVCEPLGAFVRPASRAARKARAHRARALDVVCRTLPSAPTRARWLWADERLVIPWLARNVAVGEPFVIHARGSRAAEIAIVARGRYPQARVIFDCRGAEVAEETLQLQSGRGGGVDVGMIGRREECAASQADHICVVSTYLGQHLVERYGVPPSKVTVVPCGVGLGAFDGGVRAREQSRHSLGLSGKFVVAYNGGLQAYQRPDASLQLFRRLQAHTSNAHFLALTPDAVGMRALLRARGVHEEDCTVMSAAPDAMPRLLAVADVGLLPRDASFVNRVASPVKFGEYLAAGVPVALTEGIGDCSELARKEGVGIVLSQEAAIDANACDPELIAFVNSYRREPRRWRDNCRAVARRYLDWDIHVPRLVGIYHRLCTGAAAAKCDGEESGAFRAGGS